VDGDEVEDWKACKNKPAVDCRTTVNITNLIALVNSKEKMQDNKVEIKLIMNKICLIVNSRSKYMNNLTSERNINVRR